MSEQTAVIVVGVLVGAVLTGIAWLIRAALREQTNAMQQITLRNEDIVWKKEKR